MPLSTMSSDRLYIRCRGYTGPSLDWPRLPSLTQSRRTHLCELKRGAEQPTKFQFLINTKTANCDIDAAFIVTAWQSPVVQTLTYCGLIVFEFFHIAKTQSCHFHGTRELA